MNDVDIGVRLLSTDSRGANSLLAKWHRHHDVLLIWMQSTLYKLYAVGSPYFWYGNFFTGIWCHYQQDCE
jgi:hypothetical protein